MKKKLLLSVILLCTAWMTSGQWTYTDLSGPKKFMGVTSYGSKAYFAGGYNGLTTIAEVESYDVETSSWGNIGNLSVSRQVVTGVANGSKLFFAGGANASMSTVYSTVDIYDIDSGEWSVQNLSLARFDISAVSHGSKVFFAGGCDYNINCTNVIDVYDVSNGYWSIEHLSSPRAGMASAVVGDLAIFAGGFNTGGGVSSQVDIYNFITGEWTMAALSQPRVWASAVTVGDKVIIAGGIKYFPNNPSDRVDIFNSSNLTWTTDTLSEARAWITAGAINGKAFFAGGANVANGGIPHDFTNVIDKYNVAAGTWSYDTLSLPRASNGLAVGNHFLVAGGACENGILSSVGIYSEGVLIHVPADYETIQQAIDAAGPGDTVLVADNTYYENISFKGKAIVVASEFMMDGDTNHISNTIIDGSQPVDPDFGSVVRFMSGEDTTSVLCGFTITGGTGTIEPSVNIRMGGGIQISFSGAKLLNNIIHDNVVSYNSGAYGGGIQAGGPLSVLPWIVMRHNRVMNNKALASDVYATGGGIAVYYNLILTDNEVSYNEVNCPAGCDGGGASLAASFSPTRLDIRNNTFTHNKAVSLGANSIYTIGGGLVIAYESSGIVSGNNISFNQIESADNTWGQANGVLVQQVIADDFIFENNFMTNNTHIGDSCIGGGLFLYETGGKFQNNVIMANTGTHGAGIAVENSPGLNPDFVNNTVTGNMASVRGGGLYLKNASAHVMNTIIWGNTAPNESSISLPGSTLEVRYSDVQGTEIWPGHGNINTDPGFADNDWHIDQFSSCEDQGADSVNIFQKWHYAPAYDIEGTPRPWHMGIDIGADEVDIIGISQNPPVAAYQVNRVKASPNPFYNHTTISYDLVSDTRVELKLYNSQGELVRVLLSGVQPKGSHVIEFDSEGLPAGIYFCELNSICMNQKAVGKLVKIK